MKKMERLQKENMILQHKIDDYTKKEFDECKDNAPVKDTDETNTQVRFFRNGN